MVSIRAQEPVRAVGARRADDSLLRVWSGTQRTYLAGGTANSGRMREKERVLQQELGGYLIWSPLSPEAGQAGQGQHIRIPTQFCAVPIASLSTDLSLPLL